MWKIRGRICKFGIMIIVVRIQKLKFYCFIFIPHAYTYVVYTTTDNIKTTTFSFGVCTYTYHLNIFVYFLLVWCSTAHISTAHFIIMVFENIKKGWIICNLICIQKWYLELNKYSTFTIHYPHTHIWMYMMTS